MTASARKTALHRRIPSYCEFATDTAGPMARTVTDAAVLLTVLAGIDADVQATAAIFGRVPEDYAGTRSAKPS
jgi:Asp-tRNA(Asn)/Glu-tRNA(Gln) amidotransferase A subunit family amidase